MTEPFAVAPNNTNTLARPLRRIRFGADERDPGGDTQWQVWIPSKGGGRLSLTHDGGAKLGIITLSGEILDSGSGSISAAIPVGSHGWYYVVSSGSAGTIRCRFNQTAWSRVGRGAHDPPLIPYNFYFWPYDSGPGGKRDVLLDTLKRYAATSGRDPAEAIRWENAHHSMAPGQSWGGFEGHCHQAAPASALFELPPEKTSISAAGFAPDETFDREQMKILGTEFFGNHGNVRQVWRMPGWVDRVGTNSVLSYLRPGEPKNKNELMAAMTSVFGAAIAQVRVEEFCKQINGEQNVDQATSVMFGVAAAGFYNALVGHMLMDGQPLMSNLRVFDVTHPSPRGVWNHVIFHYSADFVETPGSNDPSDMRVTCTFAANVDAPPPYVDQLPATATGGVVVPGTAAAVCRRQILKWRLAFDRLGAATGAGVEWLECKGIAGISNTLQLYPPIDLNVVERCAVENQTRMGAAIVLDARHRKHGDTKDWGNPAVGIELVKDGYMKLRARFR